MIERRFILFIVASGLAAIANFGSRIALSHVMAYVPAIVLAYLIGMATAFLLNRAYVFKDANKPLASQVMWFVAVNALALLQTLVVSLLFSHYVFPWMGLTFHPETLAHALGVIAPAVVSYFGHKHFTFRKS
ncbi:GtrA family protein [Stenotrophomonas maltophilia]|uniref:GtrA family protein n=1 Tax=Stenotrophomonas maltophilia group TaxID=995085 RepID=UPI0002BE4425|nr:MULTISPECIES: GtrA family protein [Stenotrophomonas maltophilia group]EMI51459.1 transmembrane cell surface polysaccharide biosynthesis protein [Stenotrophomonas maltophilia AU12-09]MCU1159239.1 GtrA family protein [Stenotrophomonas maltophilia]PSD24900.1 GtrA family protein [Stenotrophomonas maltophilia]